MPSKKPDIPISSFVKKLAEAKKNGPAFITSGYVGAVDDKTVRLYLDLSLETYAEISRSAVLHIQQVKDDQHDRTELMIAGNTNIALAFNKSRIMTPSDLEQAQALHDTIKGQRPQPSRDIPANALTGDPCAKPQARPDCGCGNAVAGTASQAATSEEPAGPDLLRVAGRVALGPFGFLLDL